MSAVNLTSQGRPYHDNWRVRNKRILPRDRVFVLRQGGAGTGFPATGIVAEGFVIEGSFESRENRDGTGRRAYRVDIELRTVLGPEDTPLSWPLPSREYKGKYKGPFASGIKLDDGTAEEIESWWR